LAQKGMNDLDFIHQNTFVQNINGRGIGIFNPLVWIRVNLTLVWIAEIEEPKL